MNQRITARACQLIIGSNLKINSSAQFLLETDVLWPPVNVFHKRQQGFEKFRDKIRGRKRPLILLCSPNGWKLQPDLRKFAVNDHYLEPIIARERSTIIFS